MFNLKIKKYICFEIIFSLCLFLLSFSPVFACSGNCPSGCYTSGSCGCTGPGGCRNTPPSCYSGEFFCQGYLCCDNCDYSCGSCSCTPPGCPANYTATNTGCSTTQTSCTKYYQDSCCGSCGDEYRTCWLVTYTLTYSADANGSITGSSPQTICYGGNGVGVTAVPNGSYYFVNWSDSSTANPRTDVGVTGNISVTANFALIGNNPTAPTSLLAENQTNPVGVTDITPEFSAIFNDPDTGNTANWYQVQVNTNSSFTGTIMWDSGLQSTTPTAIGSRSPDISYAGTALSLNGTTYYWRIRFADNTALTGAWSSAASFTMNTAPTAPTSLTTENQSNPTAVTDITPEFSAVFNDPNSGDTGNYYEIEVNTNSSFTGTVMWTSGLQSMTATAIGASSPQISYAGTALSLNTATYYWRIRFADNYGTTGPWSSVANFTMALQPIISGNCVLQKSPQNTYIVIKWLDLSSNEDGYAIEKKTDGGAFTAFDTVSAGTTAYTDNSVSAGHTYKYRIAAYSDTAYADWCETPSLSLQSGGIKYDGIIFK